MNEIYPTFQHKVCDKLNSASDKDSRKSKKVSVRFTSVKLELRKIQKMTGNQLKKHLDQQLLNELNPEIKLIIMINYLTTRVHTLFDRARVIFRNSSIIELGKPS